MYLHIHLRRVKGAGFVSGALLAAKKALNPAKKIGM
jgi:hypothetical protein